MTPPMTGFFIASVSMFVMPSISVIGAEEKDDTVEYVVEISTAGNAPRSVEKTIAQLKALEAYGLVEIPREVASQFIKILSLPMRVGPGDFPSAPFSRVQSVTRLNNNSNTLVTTTGKTIRRYKVVIEK